ncbi:MAG: FeoA family protein [Clostridiaceae bacterium]
MTLDKLPVGETAIITRVGGEGVLRCRLLDMGIIPKTKVVVGKIAPLGDPIEIRIRDYTLTLRMEDAEKIEIRQVEADRS